MDSSVLSLTVATVSVPVPLVPMLTVRVPVEPLMKLPFWLTFTLTFIEVVGAGDAVSVNVAFAPSVMGEVPAEIDTDGVPSGEVSLSLTVTVAEDGEPTV